MWTYRLEQSLCKIFIWTFFFWRNHIWLQIQKQNIRKHSITLNYPEYPATAISNNINESKTWQMMELTKFFAALLQHTHKHLLLFYCERFLFKQYNQMLHHFILSHYVSRTALHVEISIAPIFSYIYKENIFMPRCELTLMPISLNFFFHWLIYRLIPFEFVVCGVHKRLIFIINKLISSAE